MVCSPKFRKSEISLDIRGDHGAGVMEWTSAGVCDFCWSRTGVGILIKTGPGAGVNFSVFTGVG